MFTCVVVDKGNFRQRQGVVERHEDGRLHGDVYQVQAGMAQEVGRSPQPYNKP